MTRAGGPFETWVRMSGKPTGPPLPAWVAVFWTIAGFLDLATALLEWSQRNVAEGAFYTVIAAVWFGGGMVWRRQRRRARGG